MISHTGPGVRFVTGIGFCIVWYHTRDRGYDLLRALGSATLDITHGTKAFEAGFKLASTIILGGYLEPIWSRLQRGFCNSLVLGGYLKPIWSRLQLGFKCGFPILGRYLNGMWSQFEAGFNGASNAIPQYWDGFWSRGDSGILKFLKKSNLDKPCWVSHWQRDASSRILAHGLPQVPELLVAGCQLKKIFFVCPQAMWVTKLEPTEISV